VNRRIVQLQYLVLIEDVKFCDTSLFFQVVMATCDETRLSFTAPGSSLDSETPAAAYSLKIAATAANLSGVLFDTGMNEFISEADLVSGSLTPVPGGQPVLISLSASRCPPKQLVYLAMRAVNAANQTSAVSNIVAAMPTCSTSSTASAMPTCSTSSTASSFIMAQTPLVIIAAFFLDFIFIRF
jgi:hypothetical protein